MNPTFRTVRLAVVALAVTLVAGVPSATAQDRLPSWNNGATKTAIVEFVGKVTRREGPDYVPPAARIDEYREYLVRGSRPIRGRRVR